MLVNQIICYNSYCYRVRLTETCSKDNEEIELNYSFGIEKQNRSLS